MLTAVIKLSALKKIGKIYLEMSSYFMRHYTSRYSAWYETDVNSHYFAFENF